MQSHLMTFMTFLDKHVAVDYIKEHIEPDDFDECLTELKVAFFTGIELTKSQVKRMTTELKHSSYTAHDF